MKNLIELIASFKNTFAFLKELKCAALKSKVGSNIMKPLSSKATCRYFGSRDCRDQKLIRENSGLFRNSHSPSICIGLGVIAGLTKSILQRLRNCSSVHRSCLQLLVRSLAISCLSIALLPFFLETAASQNRFNYYWRFSGNPSETEMYVKGNAPSEDYPYLKGRFVEDIVHDFRYYELNVYQRVRDRSDDTGTWSWGGQDDINTMQEKPNEGSSFTTCNGEQAFGRTRVLTYGTWYYQTRTLDRNKSNGEFAFWFCPNPETLKNLPTGSSYVAFLNAKYRYATNIIGDRVLTWQNGEEKRTLKVTVTRTENDRPDMKWSISDSDVKHIVVEDRQSYDTMFGSTLNETKPANTDRIGATQEKWSSTGVSDGRAVAVVGTPEDAFVHDNWPGQERPLDITKENTLEYGKFYFSNDYRLFYFEPNATAINTLELGERVRAHATYSWVYPGCHSCPGGVVSADTVRVQISRPSADLSWSDNINWVDSEAGKLNTVFSKNVSSVSGNAAIQHLSDSVTLEVSASNLLASSGSETPEYIPPSTSSESGFSQEFASDYGKWFWKTDNSGFRFDPDWAAIALLGEDEIITATLDVAVAYSGRILDSDSITVTLERPEEYDPVFENSTDSTLTVDESTTEYGIIYGRMNMPTDAYMSNFSWSNSGTEIADTHVRTQTFAQIGNGNVISRAPFTGTERIIGTNFKYGKWYTNENIRLGSDNHCDFYFCIPFAFVPNSSEINKLSPGDTVTSSLRFHLHSTPKGAIEREIRLTIQYPEDSDKVLVRFDTLETDVYESGIVRLDVLLESARSAPGSVTFSVSGGAEADGFATEGADYNVPNTTSIPIATGREKVSIVIGLLPDAIEENSEKFTVTLTDSSNNLRIRTLASVATVTIIDDDAYSITAPTTACDSVEQPESVTTVNTEAYWEVTAPSVYQAANQSFRVRIGFRDPESKTGESLDHATGFYFGVFYDSGLTENPGILNGAQRGWGGVWHTIRKPSRFTGGYLRYSIVPRGVGNDPELWYSVGDPCDFYVWWTDQNKPGITLTVEEDEISEGQMLVVKATATPAPAEDLIVPFTFSDGSRIGDSQVFQILIEGGKTSGTKSVSTKALAGDQANDSETVTASYSSDYWLDSDPSIRSANFTITDHEMNIVRFEDAAPDIVVSESGSAELDIELLNSPMSELTVKYEVTQSPNQATAGTDFEIPTPQEVSFPVGITKRTISIPITEDSESEKSETFTVTLIESDGVLVGSSSVAVVTIDNDDEPEIVPPSATACNDLTQPESVTEPNTQAYWRTAAPSTYMLGTQRFTAEIGFRDPETGTPESPTHTTIFYYAAYNIDGSSRGAAVPKEARNTWGGASYDVGRPSNFTGYQLYRILPRGAGNGWYDIGTPCEFHVWWVDSTRPGITLSIDESSVQENGAFTINAIATPSPGRDIVVPISFSNSSPIQGQLNRNILIRRGEEYGTVQVKAGILPGRQHTATITATANWSGLYLLDDSKMSDSIRLKPSEFDVISVSIADGSGNEGTSGNGSVDFTVTATGTQEDPFNVMYSVTGGTADEEDFFNQSVLPFTGMVEFDAPSSGETSRTETISIPTMADNVKEASETFTITLTAVGGAGASTVVIAPSPNDTAQGRIIDDDGIEVSVADAETVERNGTSNSGSVDFVVTASGTQTTAYTVNYSISGVTADKDDFINQPVLPFTGMVEFDRSQSGETSLTETISIPIRSDNQKEPHETFTITLTSISGAGASSVSIAASPDNSAEGKILNDDGIEVSIADVEISEGTDVNGSITFDVVATDVQDQEYFVYWSVAGVTADASDFLNESFLPITGRVKFDTDSGETPIKKTISFPIVADREEEPDETFTITLTRVSGLGSFPVSIAAAPGNSAEGKILNDDGILVSIANAEGNEGTGANGMVDFTVTATDTQMETYTVNYSVSGVTADEDDFFGQSSLPFTGMVEFDVPQAGESSLTEVISIPIMEDAVKEGDETFSIELTTVTGAGASTVTIATAPNNRAEGVIANDDGIEVSVADAEGFEGTGSNNDGSVDFTVTATDTQSAAFSVNYSVAGVTADAEDFLNESSLPFTGMVEFDADQSGETAMTETISISIKEDSADEADETFTLTLTTVSGAGASTVTIASAPNNSAEGKILNDDGIMLSIENASGMEGSSSNGSVDFTVTASDRNDQEFTVNYEITAGTSNSADRKDFLNQTSLPFRDSVTFEVESGETDLRETISIPILADTTKEPDETFTLTLTSVTLAGLSSTSVSIGSNRSAEGTILNDDGVELSISNAEVLEGINTAEPIVFIVSATDNQTTSFSVDWEVTASTTKPADADDFLNESSLPFSGTVMFVAESDETPLTRQISIPITNDDLRESDETFKIALTAVGGAGSSSVEISDSANSAVGTIMNGDGIIVSIEADAEGNEGTGTHGTVDFDIAATDNLSQRFSVILEVSGGTAENSDFINTLPFTVSIPFDLENGVTSLAETASIPVMEDNVSEPDETFTVTIISVSAADTNAVVIADAPGNSAEGTILNDDGVILSIEADAKGFEGTETNSSVDFVVLATDRHSQPFAVSWEVTSTIADGTDFLDHDTLPFSGSVPFVSETGDTPLMKTISIPVMADDKPEPDESFTLTLTGVTGVGASSVSISATNNSAEGSIENDDGIILSIVADAEGVEGSSANGSVDFLVEATDDLAQPFIVNWQVVSVTADEEDFYNQSTATFNGELAFPVFNGETALVETLSIPIVADEYAENDETFTLTLTSVSGVGASSVTIASEPSNRATGKILNDDGVILSIESASGVEGNASDGEVVFIVKATDYIEHAFAVNWSVEGLTADATDFINQDSLPFTGSVDFELTSGETSLMEEISIPIMADSEKEPDETFSITLTGVTGNGAEYVIIDAAPNNTVTGTIENDDGVIVSIEGDAEGDEGTLSSGSVVFTVKATDNIALPFTVNWTVEEGTASAADFLGQNTLPFTGSVDFGLTSGETSLNEFITIPIVADNVPESNETFTITLTDVEGSGAGAVTIASAPDNSAVGTITNDDSADGTASRNLSTTWLTGFDGILIGDGYSTPDYKIAYATDNSPFGVRYGVTEVKNGVVINAATPPLPTFSHQSLPKSYLDWSNYPEFVGTEPNVHKIDDNFTYGHWYIRLQERNCRVNLCYHLLFIPNAETINQLHPNDKVSSTFITRLDNGEVSTITVSISVNLGVKLIGFEPESRFIEVVESESAVDLNVSLFEAMDDPVTIPFTIPDTGTAILNTDFMNPERMSVTIPAGKTRGTISIPLIDDTDWENRKEFTVSLSDAANAMISPSVQVASVTILNDDPRIPTTPEGGACHAVTPPSGVNSPNTEVYWDRDSLPDVYRESNRKFNLRMAFRDPETGISESITTPTLLRVGIYYIDGLVENNSDAIGKTPSADATHQEFSFSSPRNYTGYLGYRILPSKETNDEWYHVGDPCEFHILWTDARRPGITLSIEDDSVLEGRSFRVTATATPKPNRDILVPLSISDSLRIADSQDLQVRIEAGQSSGHLDVRTKYLIGDQSPDELTVSAQWRDRYFLDDSKSSATVTLVDHDKNIVEFEEPEQNIALDETGELELTVKLARSKPSEVTVSYEIGDVTTTSADYITPPNTEITFSNTDDESTITIPIVADSDYESDESFTVSLIENSGTILGDNSVVTVTILDDDPQSISLPEGKECHEVPKPDSVAIPNTEVFWEMGAPLIGGKPVVYRETGNPFDVRMGFRNPETKAISAPNHPARYYFAVYYADGTAENAGISKDAQRSSEGVDHRIQEPRGFTGYLSYRIIPRGDNPPENWHYVGTPCEFHIWWTNANRPGITLSTSERTVLGGRSFRLTATATPAPSRDILLPVSLSDVSRIEGPQHFNIRIGAGQTSGFQDILTTVNPDDQTAVDVTASAEWRNAYFLDDSKKSASVSIVSTSTISLSGPDSAIESDGQVNFTVSSSENPGSEITVKFSLSDDDTEDYLTDLEEMRDSITLTLADANSDGTYTGQIIINLDNDNQSERTGEISLELIANESDYSLGTSIVSVVTVYDDDMPEIAIEGLGPVAENLDRSADFLVTARVRPNNGRLRVYYTPEDYGDFIDRRRLDGSIELTFAIGENTAILSVPIDDDEVSEGHGRIVVTLHEDVTQESAPTYIVSTTPGANSASVAVYDDELLPLLSVVEVGSGEVSESVPSGSANFAVIVTKAPGTRAPEPFSFRFIPTQIGNFIDNASGNFTAGEVKTDTFKFVGTGRTQTHTISVPIDNDGISEETGSISIEVLEDSNVTPSFKLDSDKNSASIKVFDDEIPELSLSVLSEDSFILEDSRNSVDFRITARFSPNKLMAISYLLSETGGPYLQNSGTQTVDFDFSGGQTELDFSVNIIGNSIRNNEGVITVELQNQSPLQNYTLDSNKSSASMTIIDDEAPPKIWLIASSHSVVESIDGVAANIATFQVKSSKASSRVKVNYTVAESDTSDFLATVEEGNKIEVLTFTDDNLVQEITVILENDNLGERAGMISLTLTDPDSENDYRIADASTLFPNSATVTILDDDAPELSISAGADVTESVDEFAMFEITAQVMPRTPLSVKYTPVSTDFLSSGVSGELDDDDLPLTFTDADGDGTYTAMLNIPVYNNLSRGTDGTITVTLAPDGSANPSYFVTEGSNKTATVFVIAVESLPLLSVSGPEGVAEYDDLVTFTISAFAYAVPENNLRVYYTISQTDSFLHADHANILNDSNASRELEFTGTYGRYAATLSFQLEDNQTADPDGSVKVTINPITDGKLTYRVSESNEYSIIIFDDESPVIWLAALDGYKSGAEGQEARFAVRSNVLPATSPLQVHYRISDSDFIAEDQRGDRSIRLNFVEVDGKYSAAFSVPLRSNTNSNDHGFAIATLIQDNSDTYTVVLDDQKYPNSAEVLIYGEGGIPIVFVSRHSESVVEGQDVRFSINMVPGQSEAFSFSIRWQQVGDFIFSKYPNSIRIPPRENLELSLPTLDDRVIEANGSITLNIDKAQDYLVYGNSTVIIEDNDDFYSTAQNSYSVAAAVIRSILSRNIGTVSQTNTQEKGPQVTIAPVGKSIQEGEPAVYALTTDQAFNSNLAVKIKLEQTGNFIIGSMFRSVEFAKEQLMAEMSIETENDELAEEDGIISATIQDGSGYTVGSAKTAYLNVSDALDRLHRKNQVTSMMQTVLPDLLAYSTTRTLGITTERATHAFSDNANTSVKLNGQSPFITMLRTGGEMLNTGDIEWQSLVDDSSFSIALYPDEGAISSASIWGVGDQWSLSGEEIAGHQSWKGESLTGHFGFDARVGNSLLAGLSLSVSQSEIGYGQDGNSGMFLDTNTTGIHPYLGFNFPDGESRVQVMAGYGVNELVLSQEAYSPENLSGSYHTVGLAGNRRIYSNSFWEGHNLELSVAGEAWNSNQFLIEVAGLIDDQHLSARHTRIAIEGVQDHNLSGGDTVSHSISIGLREDGKNDKSVLGLDFGSGIGYDAFDGLEILTSGKSLLSGLNRVHRWEIANSVDVDFGNDDKGILFSMSRTWSRTDANTERFIWGSELVDASSNSISLSNRHIFNTEFGYGFNVLDGSALLTPYSAYNQSDTNGNEFQVGSRYRTSTGMDFELETGRKVSESGAVVHEYNLKGNINW